MAICLNGWSNIVMSDLFFLENVLRYFPSKLIKGTLEKTKQWFKMATGFLRLLTVHVGQNICKKLFASCNNELCVWRLGGHGWGGV